MKENQINESTGEIISFRTQFVNPVPAVGQDLSNEIEDVFIEVQPFAVDPATGKFLNELSVPKVVPNGKVNVQERIQSFAKEVDLYSILEKFAYSDDQSLINARPCQYGDVSDIPSNLNDIALFAKASLSRLDDMNPELAKMVIDNNITAEQINDRANQILAERIKEYEDSMKGDNK